MAINLLKWLHGSKISRKTILITPFTNSSSYFTIELSVCFEVMTHYIVIYTREHLNQKARVNPTSTTILTLQLPFPSYACAHSPRQVDGDGRGSRVQCPSEPRAVASTRAGAGRVRVRRRGERPVVHRRRLRGGGSCCSPLRSGVMSVSERGCCCCCRYRNMCGNADAESERRHDSGGRGQPRRQ